LLKSGSERTEIGFEIIEPDSFSFRPVVSERVTTLMIACQQGLEHDVNSIIIKKVRNAN
jgi:hypothetical protein